jgi:hypothetical protein
MGSEGRPNSSPFLSMKLGSFMSHPIFYLEMNPQFPLNEGWVVSESDLDAVEKRQAFLLCRKLDDNT